MAVSGQAMTALLTGIEVASARERESNEEKMGGWTRIFIVLNAVALPVVYFWRNGRERVDFAKSMSDVAYGACNEYPNGRNCIDVSTQAYQSAWNASPSTALIILEAIIIMAVFWACCAIVYFIAKWIRAGFAASH
jgi:formate hydrogenlyase subunit 4